MSIMLPAQHFGIESMCLTKYTQEKCEELFGLKKGSLILGVALVKLKGIPSFPEKKIQCKDNYIPRMIFNLMKTLKVSKKLIK